MVAMKYSQFANGPDIELTSSLIYTMPPGREIDDESFRFLAYFFC
jgi:hypothetical protein